jgi:hypothetical protein
MTRSIPEDDPAIASGTAYEVDPDFLEHARREDLVPARAALGPVREIRWCSIPGLDRPRMRCYAAGSGTVSEPCRLRERGQVDASGG